MISLKTFPDTPGIQEAIYDTGESDQGLGRQHVDAIRYFLTLQALNNTGQSLSQPDQTLHENFNGCRNVCVNHG